MTCSVLILKKHGKNDPSVTARLFFGGLSGLLGSRCLLLGSWCCGLCALLLIADAVGELGEVGLESLYLLHHGVDEG